MVTNSKECFVFSGFWHVENNTKNSAKQGHIKHLNRKDVDLVLTDSRGINHNKFNILPSELPSHKYLKNLRKYCLNNKDAYTKWGIKMSTDTFYNLSSIWLSKILLFSVVDKVAPREFTSIAWVDCVRNIKKEEILSCRAKDKISVIKRRHRPGRPFNQINKEPCDGLMNLWPELLGASVIKVPRVEIKSLTDSYIESLIFSDSIFSLYDEEVVLSQMNYSNPHLFNLIQE